MKKNNWFEESVEVYIKDYSKGKLIYIISMCQFYDTYLDYNDGGGIFQEREYKDIRKHYEEYVRFILDYDYGNKITLGQLRNIAETIIDSYDLDNGNSYIDLEDNNITIEAPRNTTLSLYLYDLEDKLDTFNTEEDGKKYLVDKIIEAIDQFDIDEAFKELWNRDSEFEPLEFIDLLKEDKEFYNNLKNELKKEC